MRPCTMYSCTFYYQEVGRVCGVLRKIHLEFKSEEEMVLGQLYPLENCNDPSCGITTCLSQITVDEE